jgi:hypothetical protein
MNFFPTVQQFDGVLAASFAHRTIENASGGRALETTSDTSMEQLKLSALGYVYHPRFLVYSLGGSFGLDRTFFATSDSSRRSSVYFEDYDFKTTILPEHPYNLDLYAKRNRSLESSAVTGERIMTTEQGATFRYNESPYSLNLGASSNTIVAQDTSSANTVLAMGSYLIGPFMNSAGHIATDSGSGLGYQANQRNSFYNNDLRLLDNAIDLSSSVNANHRNQRDAAAAQVRTDSLEWSERLSMSLPLNFSAYLSHGFNREDLTNEQATSRTETAFTRASSDSFAVSHQLYRSLRTSFSMNRDSSESSGGTGEATAQAVSLYYTKLIPSGGINAGYDVRRTLSSRTGSPTIASELHSTAIPGTFILNNPSVDPSTITVLVKDPVTQNLVTLTRDTNYQVVNLGNNLELAILSVPAGVNPPPPPISTFDFQVTYSLLPITSSLDFRNNNLRFGLTLLEGLFNPYFVYSTSSQEVVSGSLPGGNDSARTETIGYTVQKAPFSLLAEHSDTHSALNPSRVWRMVTDYREFVAGSIDISARVSYDSTSRPAVADGRGGVDNSERITGVDLSAHREFPLQHLNAFVGGSYTERSVLGTSSKSYGLNTNMRWHLGKLDVTAGASAGRTSSSGPIGGSTSRTVSYNITVSRKLF